MMRFLSAKGQLTFGLLSLQASILSAAMLLGFVPERSMVIADARADLCETIAVVSSQYISTNQAGELTLLLSEIVERNDNVASAGIRRIDGRLLQEIGAHESEWNRNGDRSSENEVIVPVRAGANRWGSVELRFKSMAQAGAIGWIQHPWIRMSLFICLFSFVLFYLFLRKMLRHLDPTNAVPQRVRAALDSLAEGLIVVDRKGQIVLANQAFSDWVQRPPEKLAGINAGSFEWRIEASGESPQPLTSHPWADAIDHEAPQAGVMMSLVQPDQATRTLMANASPVLGHDGKYGGVLVSFDDVTQLEDTRRDLEAAREVADHANSAKSEFLARMSHEIRTPMNAILGYTEVLRDGFDEDPNDRVTYLDTIHASGEHLLALINDILDLSKIESGQMDLDLNPHSLRDLMMQVITVMNVNAKEKSIGLSFEAAGLVPETILTDAVRFRQAVFNLVGNAVKFTEQGEVRVVVRLNDDGLLRVDVIDTGVGIAKDAVDKVFERFTQADAAVSTKFGGTGLGLSISRQLARMMGGDITVTSTPGVGSTFSLTVNPGPTNRIAMIDPTVAMAPTTRPEKSRTSLRLPPCRILIVDDEAANRSLAKIHISRAGGTCAEACDGQEAVDMASAEEFDAILMDFNMPVLGGLDATKCLRQLGITTPVIALTANVMRDDQDSAFAAGCDGFLTKPVKMVDLINGLNEILILATIDDSNSPDAAASLNAAEELSEEVAIGPDVPREVGAVDALLESLSLSSEEVKSTGVDDGPIESLLPTQDPEFYEIVADFPPRLRDRVKVMRRCYDANDFATLRNDAHWLAGTAGTLGFPVFNDAARALEAAAVAQEAMVMEEALTQIESLAPRVVVVQPESVAAV